MKKYVIVSLILAGTLLLAGCQRGLYLHFSGSKVVGVDVQGEKDETIEPSGELTWSEGPDTETSDEQTTDSEGSTTAPATTQASSTTTAPTTTAAPTITVAPTTTPAPTTPAPTTTAAPATTAAPTTTEAPTTTAAPTTTEAPTTTAAPTTTEAATTTEDTVHVEANLEHLEILTLPTKTFYDQYNEIISTEGMTLLATWADGFEKVISDGWSIVSADGTPDPRTEREGEQTIYVTYGIKSVFYTITYRLAEDAPLRLVDSFSPGRVFYQGEYLKHLYTCAYVGSTRVEPSKLSFSPERLSGTGSVTVRISYGKHEAERSFTVVPASQFVLTQEDLDWPKAATIDSLPSDCVLTAAWVYEECLERAPDFRPMNHPLISDIIPESEFTFDPRDFRDWVYGYCEVTISCRGLTSRFSLF